MVWHVPNEADAPEDPRQAALQSAALDELAAGLDGTGVVSGFGFTPAGGRTITVAAGVSAAAQVPNYEPVVKPFGPPATLRARRPAAIHHHHHRNG